MRRIFLHTPSYSHHFRPLLRPGPHMSRVVPRSETVAEHQPLAKASGLVALGCSSSLLPSPCHLVQPHTTGPFQVAVKECRMTMFLFIHRHGQTETSSNSSMQSKTVRDTVHRKKSRKNQIYSATICYNSTTVYCSISFMVLTIMVQSWDPHRRSNCLVHLCRHPWQGLEGLGIQMARCQGKAHGI